MRLPTFFPMSAAFVLSLSGCAVGPDYRAPELPAMPQAFKHDTGWQTVRTPVAEDGAWWKAYGDDRLDGLIDELEAANPGVAQAAARLRQAEAALRGTRAGFAPTVGGELSGRRSGTADAVANSYDGTLSVSWLPDVWGRVRRAAEAGQAELEGSAADLAALRLSLQASLAQAYIRLRVLDQQRELLLQTETAYTRSLQLTRNQYEAGMIARADVVQAESQLENVRAQLLELVDQRAVAENAIAVLAGRPPAGFALAADGSLVAMPPVPTALPGELLVRRPDLVVAERRVAAANARIGVAQAAWLPDLTLGLSGGYRSAEFRHWFEAPNRVWALGPTLAGVLFDSGARAAALDDARAVHEAAAEAWREAVLAALQETEDAFASLRALEARAGQQARVVALAEENERLVTNRYRAGQVSFLEVVVAQNGTLAARRGALDITRDRLQASVQLVAALGGGWSGTTAVR
ncbi:efflux transporter outer membrane subunit [Thauera linaloolentis]|nr:efflux transporter outer membrane subunit [Thauera linaloolentis]MCM8566504.1 efflux transporter outer membrane subunit [Thauera linaloolentis]